MADMTVSVIIVSYNTAELTIQTIESVLQSLHQDPSLEKHSEVIIVDNASSDDSVKRISEHQRQHHWRGILIRNKRNLGFAQANNLALKQAQGEYLFLLNSDTIVQGPALPELVSIFEAHPLQNQTADLASAQQNSEDRLGLVAAQLLNADGSVQAQGGSLPSLLSLFFHMSLLDDIPFLGHWFPSTQQTGRRQTIPPPSSDLVPSGWVGGTALMIRRAVVKEIGPLDQNIFMYGEDIEYCARARAHHWDIAICPRAHVIHLGTASSTPGHALAGEFQGYLYFWSKHKPLWQLPLVRAILLLGACLRTVLFATMGDRQRSRIYQQIARSLI